MEELNWEITDQYGMYSFPPGYVFSPTDEELIRHYLMKRITNQPIPCPNIIRDVDIYEYSPQQLDDMFQRKEKEMYFFTPRKRRYPNGSRPTRSTGNGFWKATGGDRRIPKDGPTIGYEKALVYYEGKPQESPTKTTWIMHEYRLVVKNNTQTTPTTPNTAAPAGDMHKLDGLVLCKIYQTGKKIKNTMASNITVPNGSGRCTEHSYSTSLQPDHQLPQVTDDQLPPLVDDQLPPLVDCPDLSLDDWDVIRTIYVDGMGTEEQDIPSKIVPHHDNADQVGVIISSPCTLLPNQVPAVSIDSFDYPVHKDHDMSNALNSPCQFDHFSRQISTFGQDYHHDPIAFENTRLHNYGFNNTRPDDLVFAAQVPDLAMDYDPNPEFDWCVIDQGLQLSGPTFNAHSLDYVSIPFGIDDVLNLNNDRPSESIDHEAVQPLIMSNITSDDIQNTEGLGNASENTVPEHDYEFPDLQDDLSFINNEFEENGMFTIPADMQLV